MTALNDLLVEAKTIADALEKSEATEDQMTRMPSLRREIETEKSRESEQKAFRDTLAGVITPDAQETERKGAPAKSLGEHFVSEVRGDVLDGFKSGNYNRIASSEFKAATDPSGSGDISLPTIQQDVTGLVRTQLTVASLLSQGTLDGDSLRYFEEQPGEGGASTVAPGATKPHVNYKFKQVREDLSKIAVLTDILDEMVQDYAFLVSEINTRLTYDLMLEEENQLLNGDGTAPNLHGLLNRDGVLTVDATTETLAAKIFSATMQIRTASQRIADGVVLNPADYEALRLLTDGNGQYIAGGPFQGQYGVGGTALNPPLWGLNTVVTPAVEAGSLVVGSFRSATLYRKGGVAVAMSTEHNDNFATNKRTLRAEERIALKVPRPSAFAKVTVGTAGV
ncbi:MAG: phage major capsid protein [Micrococcaceae bacterium]